MRVVLFLLDTVFFVLVGAALLRAWMNTLRLRMTQQPGLFVMAVTDWAVMPLRKVLPRRWRQANADWGSLLAVVLFCLLYAVVWHFLAAGPGRSGGWVATLPVMAVWFGLRTVLQLVMWLVLGFAVLSWVQPHSPVMAVLSRLVDPFLNPLRRVVPTLGGVDLSALALLLLLQIGLMLLG